MFVGGKGEALGQTEIPVQSREQGPRWRSALDEGKVISLNAVILNEG